jgi:hypothetical protein
VLDIPLWEMEVREQFLKDRLLKHNEAAFAMGVGDQLEECTSKEMWEKPTVYAIRKIGGVRAKTLHGSKEKAEEDLAELNAKKKEYEIEVREGGRTRCEGFCQVSQYCDQFQRYLVSKGVEVVENITPIIEGK